MLCGARGQHLDLHARHVDAGRAFAAAGLARDAELQRLGHLVRGERVRPELSCNRKPQRVGAPARDVALLARDAIGRAHHAALDLAAGAVVVAHLDRALESAAGAGPGGPVELGLHLLAAILGPITEVRAVIELRRAHDLAGVEDALRVEGVLHLLEGLHQLLAEHELVEFGAHDAVAVLAGMRALVVAHHREGFLGDGAHRLHVLLLPQVQHRAHVQAADRGVRVPGAARAVLLEHLREALRVVREVDQRHRAVLDEGDRLPLLLHRHHDVEAGGAHVGDRGLQRRIGHLDHTAPFGAVLVEAEAEIAHRGGEILQPALVLHLALVELDQQDRLRLAVHEGLQRRAEHGDLARELQHGAVDQLDRDRLELDQMLRRIHRLIERAEMARAHHAPAQHRRQLQLDACGKRERALRAEQDVREIVLRRVRREGIEIVAADAPLHLGKVHLDLVRLAQTDVEQRARERAQWRACRQVRETGIHGAEMRLGAVGQHRVDRAHVVAHRAVAQRAPAAGVVRRHAADCCARGGRDIDREPEAVGLELAVQVIEHDAGLDRAALLADVDFVDLRQILRAVDDQRLVDGLTGLRGAATSRQHADPLRARKCKRALGFCDRARRDHAKWRHLVVRGVCRIAPAAEAVEHHVAGDLGLQLAFQPRQQLRGGHAPLRAKNSAMSSSLTNSPRSACARPSRIAARVSGSNGSGGFWLAMKLNSNPAARSWSASDNSRISAMACSSNSVMRSN